MRFVCRVNSELDFSHSIPILNKKSHCVYHSHNRIELWTSTLHTKAYWFHLELETMFQILATWRFTNISIQNHIVASLRIFFDDSWPFSAHSFALYAALFITTLFHSFLLDYLYNISSFFRCCECVWTDLNSIWMGIDSIEVWNGRTLPHRNFAWFKLV